MWLYMPLSGLKQHKSLIQSLCNPHTLEFVTNQASETMSSSQTSGRAKQPCKDQPPRGVYAERVLSAIFDACESHSVQKRSKCVKNLVKYIIASKAGKAAKARNEPCGGEYAKRVLCLVHQVAASSGSDDRGKFIDDYAAWLGLDSHTTCKQIVDKGCVVTTFTTTTPHLVETTYIHGLAGVKQLPNVWYSTGLLSVLPRSELHVSFCQNKSL